MKRMILLLFIIIISTQPIEAKDDIRTKLIKQQVKYSANLLNHRIRKNNEYLSKKQYQLVDFIVDEYKEKGLGSFISKDTHDMIADKLARLNVMTGLHFYVYISQGVPSFFGRDDIVSNPQKRKKYAWYLDVADKAQANAIRFDDKIIDKQRKNNDKLRKKLKAEHLFYANLLVNATKFEGIQKNNGVLLVLRMQDIYEIPFWSVYNNKDFKVTEQDILNLIKGKNSKKLRHVDTWSSENFYVSRNIDTESRFLTNQISDRYRTLTQKKEYFFDNLANIAAPYTQTTNQRLYIPKRDLYTKYHAYFVSREIFKFRESVIKSRRISNNLQYILQGFDAYDIPIDITDKFRGFENHPIFRVINNNSKIDRYRLANPTYTFKILDQYKTRLTQKFLKENKDPSKITAYINDFTKDNGVFSLQDGESFKIGYELKSGRTAYIDVFFHEKRPTGIKLIGKIYNKETEKDEEVHLTTIPLLNTFKLEQERQRMLLVEFLTTWKEFLKNLSDESKKAFEENQHITAVEWLDLLINGGAVGIGVVITAATDGYGVGALFIAFDNLSASLRKIKDKWNEEYYDPNSSKYKTWGAQLEGQLGGTSSGLYYDLGGLFVGSIGSSAKLSSWAQKMTSLGSSKHIPKFLKDKKILPLFYKKTLNGKQKLQNAEHWLNSLNLWVARSGVGLSLFGKGKLKDNVDLEKYIKFLKDNPPAEEIAYRKQQELINYFDKLIEEAKKRD